MKIKIIIERESDKSEKVNTRIMDLEMAVEKAIKFSKASGNAFTRLDSVKETNERWYIRLDVGTYMPIYRTVVVDKHGNVIGFTKS
jgi:hypothetical protein